MILALAVGETADVDLEFQCADKNLKAWPVRSKGVKRSTGTEDTGSGRSIS